MHLIRLSIPRWKNLKNLVVNFDQTSFTTVFGRVVEAVDKSESAISYERAAVSISLYHLNESKLVKKRRDLCNEISRLIQEAISITRYTCPGTRPGSLATSRC